jgi:hypothetical protein
MTSLRPRRDRRQLAIRSRFLLAAAALGLALPLASARGQELEESIDEVAVDLDEAVEEKALPEPGFLGEAGFVYQSDADLDDGGSLEVFRWDIGLVARTDLTEKLRWSNTFFLGIHDYDFSGGGVGAVDPWDTILNPRLATKLTYEINPQWGVSAGGIFIFSPETGADWGDSFTGGGLLAAEFRPSEKFVASLGVAVISQLEDDAAVAPAVGLLWLPAERWTLRVGGVPASGGTSAAAELAYRLSDPVDLGLGVLYHQRRFRLDDDGVVPDGVGEDNNLPVRLRLGLNLTDHISLNLLAGAVFAGEVELEDESGNRLADDEYDPAAYVGLRFAGRF